MVVLRKETLGRLWAHSFKNGKVLLLGRYDVDTEFKGTDKLSMGIVPVFKNWVNENRSKKIKVMFEGTRLFNGKVKDFLESNKIRHTFINVVATPTKVSKQILKRSGGKGEGGQQIKARITQEKNLLDKYNDIKSLTQAKALQAL